MRPSALALAAALSLAVAGPAAAASATWTDSDTDNAGGPEILGLTLESDALYLTGTTVMGEGIALPGDALAWYLDADGNIATGEPGSGFDWRIAYQVSSISGNPIGGASPWGPGGWEFSAPSPPSFSQSASAEGDVVTWRAGLSELGVAANGTVRFQVTASYQGIRDWAPDGIGDTFSFNVLTGQVAPAAPVAEALAAIRPPRASGRARVGGLLRCATGTWSGSPERLVVTWQRQVSGGRWRSVGRRARLYSPRRADAGKRVRCQVKAFAGGRSTVARSRAVKVRR